MHFFVKKKKNPRTRNATSARRYNETCSFWQQTNKKLHKKGPVDSLDASFCTSTKCTIVRRTIIRFVDSSAECLVFFFIFFLWQERHVNNTYNDIIIFPQPSPAEFRVNVFIASCAYYIMQTSCPIPVAMDTQMASGRGAGRHFRPRGGISAEENAEKINKISNRPRHRVLRVKTLNRVKKRNESISKR